VSARYSSHYTVNNQELAWLAERLAVLRELVQAVCEERLKT